MKEYDKLSIRLVQILSKFNNGESLSAQELAQEFNVDTRTIQRDLNERLAFMPIKKENGRYVLESFALGKLSFKDIQNFATLSGAELYPKLDQGFIVDLLSHRVNKVLMVKNEGFQKVDYELFKDLSVAILKHNVLNFFYKDKERQIKPYKLVNYKGIWYLLGDENDKLKHFNLDKISKLHTKNENFIPDEKLEEQIQNDPNIWLGESKEVILKLDKNAKEYFFRKEILSNYQIIDKDETSYTLSTQVSYEDEILHLVKQWKWIPYIKILAPIELKIRLEDILKSYLNNLSK
ncbi:YafY family transcriptional regulator [Campylobacter jejuni]|nr:YafY family transcriptional regulator [Campylobacter jejuni]EAI0544089.1 YafY family transcriptional regulator [Campylobacter jejuni]EAI0604815.1 YafY family transcriptional regulator [Campylobacter jejuni]EAI4793987.1 YafY family transcriptional regulator [Campylobacter jejuni]EAI7483604.1 YafY family transcriptional regulator [Campylobacter jejuni]